MLSKIKKHTSCWGKNKKPIRIKKGGLICSFLMCISLSISAQSTTSNSGIEIKGNTATLYFENQSEWTNSFNFLCFNGACISGALNTSTNRWERTVDAIADQEYQIQIKISSTIGGQYISDVLNSTATNIDNNTGGGNNNNAPLNPVIALNNNAQKGIILVGGQDASQPGFSLYTFDNDNGTLPFSDCYNDCETNWPPVTVTKIDDLIITDQVKNTFPLEFGLSARCDGSIQVTYDRKPLYYFITDTEAGQTNGDDVGGVWHLIVSDTNTQACTGIDIPTAQVTKTNETVEDANDGKITLTFDDIDNRDTIEFSIDGGQSYAHNSPDNAGSYTIDNLADGTYNVWARWGNDECPTDITSITIVPGSNPNDPCNDTPDVGTEGDDFVMGLNTDGIAYHLNPGGQRSFRQLCLDGFCVESTLNPDKNNRLEVDFSDRVAAGQTYTLETRIQGNGPGYETGQCIYSIQVQTGEGVESTPCYTPNNDGGDTGTPVTAPDPILAVGSNADLGAFLIGASGTDKPGFSLYITSGDCTGNCIDNWPPVLVDDPDTITTPGGITNTVGAVEYGEIDCTLKYQATLDGKLLYFYSQDTATGDTNGHTVGTWEIAKVNRLPKAPDAEHMMSALKTPINGRTPGDFGWVHDINGRNVAVRAGAALQLQFHQTEYVGGVGSVLNGFGDPDWTFVCSCNQVEFYEAEMTITEFGKMNVEIPGNCFDKFYYFFRYKKAGLPTDDLGTQVVFSTLFEYDERTPNDRIDPATQPQITSNSANWMRFRHPRAHDGNTESIYDSYNNAGLVRGLDRYTTTVTTGGSGTTIDADLPNILRIEALDNGLIKNSNPAYVYNTNTCCGTHFDYGNVITYEITIGSGAQISSQIYNTFQHVVVGKGFDSSIGDPRLTLAGRGATTMEFSTNNEAESTRLEQNAIFTQHLTTLTTEKDVDDFLEGHHIFHGLQDQFGSTTAGPVLGSAKIGTKACQDCHFRDGRGSQPELTRDGKMRVPPPVFGTGLLQWVENAEAVLTWNGDVKTVREQVSNALLQDHGVEAASIGSDFDLLVAYTEFLTVPNRNAAAYLDPDVVDGDRLFREVSCTSCHQPTQKTSNDAPEKFRNMVIRPYSDLKMHTVTDDAYRTPPLWGLGRNIDLLETNGKALVFMHDGSASTLEEAIQAHGEEASDSRAQYNALSASDKTKLIKFLRTL